MRVALVRPPIEFLPGVGAGFVPSRVYNQWFTRYPPLALLYYASILERAGHEVAVADAEVLEHSIEDVVRSLVPFRPGMVCVNVNVFHPWIDLRNSETLGRALGVPVVARGHFSSLYPEEVARHPFVYAVIRSKGFSAIGPLVSAVESGSSLASVPDLVYRDGGGALVRTADEPPLVDMDSLPHPARHLVPNDLYMTNLTVRDRFTTAFSSLGCPYSCLYCVDRRVPYVARSPENVLDEIERCVEDLGIHEICYLDPTFTARRRRALEICRGIVERRLDLAWTMRTRPDLVDDEILGAAARAGCVRVSLGIESADPGILERLGRGMDNETIEKAVRAARRHGIMVFGYFMIGSPGETEETARSTIRFARGLPLNFAQFMRVLPMPATGVLERTKEVRGVDVWLEVYRRKRFGLELVSPPDTGLSGEDLNRWVGRAYLSFYLNPRLIVRNLRLRYAPAYALRQIRILALMARQAAARRLREMGLTSVRRAVSTRGPLGARRRPAVEAA